MAIRSLSLHRKTAASGDWDGMVLPFPPEHRRERSLYRDALSIRTTSPVSN